MPTAEDLVRLLGLRPHPEDGFDFADIELGRRAPLLAAYPFFRDSIPALTRSA